MILSKVINKFQLLECFDLAYYAPLVLVVLQFNFSGFYHAFTQFQKSYRLIFEVDLNRDTYSPYF